MAAIDEASGEDAFSGSDAQEAHAAVTVDSTKRRRKSRQPRISVVVDKDSEEEELERLVLGDAFAFRQRLLGQDLLLLNPDADTGGSSAGALLPLVEAEQYPSLDLAHVDDVDLFVFDVVGDKQQVDPQSAATTLVPGHPGGDPDSDSAAPVWHDSDDDRVTVSLLGGASRLRRLRVTEAEDVISGTEYCRRLRQQFLRLNPPPAWARPRREHGRKKSSRRSSRPAPGAGSQLDGPPSSSSSSSSSESGGETDHDDDADLSTLPLSRFLRDANALANNSANSAASKRQRRLRPETLDIQRTRDIPTTLGGPVSSLSFHPQEPILLSSSPASIMHLHRIDPTAHPTPNPELLSVKAQHVDVRRAQFAGPRGDRVLFAGRRRYIHTWDLDSGLVRKVSQVLGHHRLQHKTMERFRTSPCGRWLAVLGSSRKGGGSLSVLDAASMQWIASARLDSRHGVADFAWWHRSAGLTILGKDGRVGEWSLADRTFKAIWHDHGCVGAIVLAVGGADGPPELGGHRWVAVGSSSGIANLYDRRDLFSASVPSPTGDLHPTPARILEQLVTPITALAFSPDGQLFAFASEHKRDALRLVHLPSCTVYRNWPTQQTPLGRITALAFAAHDSLLAVGNSAGKIRLWEIRG